MVLDIIIGGFALEVLVQGIKGLLEAVRKLFPFELPENFYLYLNAGLAVVGTAVLAFAPLQGWDLGVVGAFLSDVNEFLEYLALLIASPLVAFLIRQLQKVSCQSGGCAVG
jgi:hypothetical protein